MCNDLTDADSRRRDQYQPTAPPSTKYINSMAESLVFTEEAGENDSQGQ